MRFGGANGPAFVDMFMICPQWSAADTRTGGPNPTPDRGHLMTSPCNAHKKSPGASRGSSGWPRGLRSLETQTLSQNIEPAKRASRKHASALMGKVASPREASLRWRRQRLRRIRSRHAPMQGHNQRPRARRARSAPGGPAAYTDFRFESREGSAPTRRGERRAGTGPRRDGLGRVMTN